MFDFGSQFVQNKLFFFFFFFFFCISSMNCFENEVINGKYTIVDSANVLKITNFSSSVIFVILHQFKTFQILVILFMKLFCICKFSLGAIHKVHMQEREGILSKVYIYYFSDVILLLKCIQGGRGSNIWLI